MPILAEGQVFRVFVSQVFIAQVEYCGRRVDHSWVARREDYEVKFKQLPYFLGLQPGPKSYGFKVKSFDLPRDGTVEYAQWLHPHETEKEITQSSIDALRKFLSPGDVAIDIGAHTGDSTIPIALAVGKQGCVLALEPNRYVFSVLKKNAELNPAKTNIIPLMFAATPEDAEMEFQYSDSGYCNGGRFEGMSKWLHGHAFKLSVQGRNLSAFIEKNFPELLPRIRYIKMDTEGYELAVLQTLSGLIAQCKPFLKVEVYRKLDDLQRQALFRSLSAHGYTIHKIADDGDGGNDFGEKLTEQDMSNWRHFDVFCVPAS
ncbi:MAG TPA: FkbM family methyltransferase [Candidatus Dormibacteraeota bacterium]|nr:FkbM family methyltransferase [Candidatus Dormibacteraeota bacterium]